MAVPSRIAIKFRLVLCIIPCSEPDIFTLSIDKAKERAFEWLSNFRGVPVTVDRVYPIQELRKLHRDLHDSHRVIERSLFSQIMDSWRFDEYLPEYGNFWRQMESPEILCRTLRSLGARISVAEIYACIGKYKTFEVSGRRYVERSRRFPRRDGSRKTRQISAPCEDLMILQKFILNSLFSHYDLILSNVAHAYRVGRSTVTCMRPHIHAGMVVKMDFSNFFDSISSRWVKRSLISRLGFSGEAAEFISNICTVEKRNPRKGEHTVSRKVLPQGGPTSGFLSNLVLVSLDQLLISSLRDIDPGIIYTRYADDLIISTPSDSQIKPRRIISRVSALAAREGLSVNRSKTRVYFSGGRMRALGLDIYKGELFPRSDLLNALSEDIQRLGDHRAREDMDWDETRTLNHLLGTVVYVFSINERLGRQLFGELENHVGELRHSQLFIGSGGSVDGPCRGK